MKDLKLKYEERSRVKYNVKRTWVNAFAQTCYELGDGTIIYISLNDDEVEIVKRNIVEV